MTRGGVAPPLSWYYDEAVGAESFTLVVDRSGELATFKAPRFSLTVVEGDDLGVRAESVDGRLTVGTAESVHLRLSDPTVSRFHAELVADERGICLRDLGSTNGTLLVGAQVGEVVLNKEAEFRLGKSKVRLRLGAGHSDVETSAATLFGDLIGASAAMRRVFTLLERAAPTPAPVLITGESGTGKELAARALHQASDRKDGPFEVVDCGGLPPTLIESELFGHQKGSFTNAAYDRAGAFERADGGTLFLDELGELPLELQPKLLRALGERQVRRIGSNETRTVDVRLLAATNRDLRREVNNGTFRADVYYRLAVIQVQLPPLRERKEDLPLLVRGLLEQIAHDRQVDMHIEPDGDLIETLSQHSWPGNVRELRNYLDQLLILREMPAFPSAQEAELTTEAGTATALFDQLQTLPLRIAKGQLVEQFERQYLQTLLQDTKGNVAEAARRAGVDRGTLFRSIRRYGLKDER